MDLLIALGVWATIVLSATWLFERHPAPSSSRAARRPGASRVAEPCRQRATR